MSHVRCVSCIRVSHECVCIIADTMLPEYILKKVLQDAVRWCQMAYFYTSKLDPLCSHEVTMRYSGHTGTCVSAKN